jgi:hypothetical protein
LEQYWWRYRGDVVTVSPWLMVASREKMEWGDSRKNAAGTEISQKKLRKLLKKYFGAKRDDVTCA